MEKSRNKTWVWAECLFLILVVIAILFVLTREKNGKDNTENVDPTHVVQENVPDPGQLMNTTFLLFENASSGLPLTGAWRGMPVLHDLNHDGNLDAIVSLRIRDDKQEDGKEKTRTQKSIKSAKPALAEESGLYVFLGDGKGNWKESNEGIPPTLGYGGAETGDFNNDGNPDILFSTHCGTMKVFLGDGTGKWSESSQGIDNTTLIEDVAVADFNGDGFEDIAGISMFPEGGGGVYCFANSGHVTWTRMHEEPLIDNGSMGHEIRVADINKDGHPDIVVASNRGMKVFLNDGAGQFSDFSRGLPNPQIGNSISCMDVGDITGDGILDLVVGAYAANSQVGLEVYVQVPESDGVELDWKRLYTGPYERDFTFGVVLGDMDGDKDLDMVVSSYNDVYGSRLMVFENDGTGLMTEIGHIKDGCGRASLALGDVNNDGRLDVLTVFSEAAGGVRVYVQK
ncbi:MAG: VCBS repeat-containing protein [Planctomycetota bacterium]